MSISKINAGSIPAACIQRPEKGLFFNIKNTIKRGKRT